MCDVGLFPEHDEVRLAFGVGVDVVAATGDEKAGRVADAGEEPAEVNTGEEIQGLVVSSVGVADDENDMVRTRYEERPRSELRVEEGEANRKGVWLGLLLPCTQSYSSFSFVLYVRCPSFGFLTLCCLRLSVVSFF